MRYPPGSVSRTIAQPVLRTSYLIHPVEFSNYVMYTFSSHHAPVWRCHVWQLRDAARYLQ